jgi:hypothetical protein
LHRAPLSFPWHFVDSRAPFLRRDLLIFDVYARIVPKGQIEPIPDPFIEAIVSGKQGPLPAGVQLILGALRRCDHWSFD